MTGEIVIAGVAAAAVVLLVPQARKRLQAATIAVGQLSEDLVRDGWNGIQQVGRALVESPRETSNIEPVAEHATAA